MANIHRKIICGMMLLVIFSVSSCDNDAMRKKAIHGNEIYDLSWKEAGTFKKEAERGSGDAAYKLAMYYDRIRGNHKKAFYWFEVGAKNGNVDCLYEFSLILIYSNNGEEVRKGYEGMEKAASFGHRDAQKIIREKSQIPRD